MTPEETEVRLLSSIVSQDDLTWLLREGITADAFLVFGDVFAYALEYGRLYEGRIPEPRDLEAQFTEIGLTLESPGELKFYTEELRKQDKVRRTQAAIFNRLGKVGDKILNDPDEAVRLLAEDLRGLRKSQTSNIAVLDRDALTRLAWVKERQAAAEAGLVLGIPTGLKIFDDNLQGWQPSETIMLMGPKGIGKSWMMMYFACVAYQAGKKVLFMSPEMSWQECAFRFDVVLAAQCGRELSHTELMTGKMDNLDIYQSWLEDLSTREAFICMDSAESDNGVFSLATILGAIDEYRPDLVVFDGIHLVGGDDRMTGWERIKKAADGLKASAQLHKNVVIWSSQVDRDAMRNPTEPAANGASAAYGKAAVEAANRLITLAGYSGDSRRRTFKVPNNRNGQEYHTKQHLLFDVDWGKIEQLEVALPSSFEADDNGDVPI